MYNLNQIHLGIYKRIMSFKWKFKLLHFGSNSLIHKPLQVVGGGYFNRFECHYTVQELACGRTPDRCSRLPS